MFVDFCWNCLRASSVLQVCLYFLTKDEVSTKYWSTFSSNYLESLFPDDQSLTCVWRNFDLFFWTVVWLVPHVGPGAISWSEFVSWAHWFSVFGRSALRQRNLARVCSFLWIVFDFDSRWVRLPHFNQTWTNSSLYAGLCVAPGPQHFPLPMTKLAD